MAFASDLSAGSSQFSNWSRLPGQAFARTAHDIANAPRLTTS
jgi:hypothetical protein